MKSTRGWRAGWVVAAAVLVAMFPPALGSQQKESQAQKDIRELKAINTALAKESVELGKASQSAKGMELEAVRDLTETVAEAGMEIDNTVWFLDTYDKMQCEPDRAVAKATLQNRLKLNTTLLGAQVYQIDGALALAESPATTQSGKRIQEQVKAAEAKLKQIAAGLK